MIPRLLRVYGGTPQSWLDVNPALFWACVRMMPQLLAEEEMARIYEARVAHGLVEGRGQRDHIDALRRAVLNGRRKQKQSETEIRANMAAIGIVIEG